MTESKFTTASVLSGASTEGKYIPPSLRPDFLKSRDGSNPSSRQDSSTLRVTNLSEDTTDDDVRDLFGRFGRITKLYLGKDQVTGLCRGFAFVTFETRSSAEKALEKVDGLPYEYQILGCSWKGELCAYVAVDCVKY